MTAAMKSLDLFSGVGGITHALRGGVATPLAYCEMDHDAVGVLERQMKRGRLPRAPICPDVRALDEAWIRENCGQNQVPDLIVGGFPCVGFSGAGAMEGFAHSGSALFSEIVRLVDVIARMQRKTKVDRSGQNYTGGGPVLFLENVSNIVQMGLARVIHDLGVRRSYELRWCTLSASTVGAPHRRSRWYCLALPPGHRYRGDSNRAPPRFLRYVPYDWPKQEVPRTKAGTKWSTEVAPTVRLMGNSVVPDAVRTAYAYLSSGFGQADARRTPEHVLPVLSAATKLRASPPAPPFPASGMWSKRIGLMTAADPVPPRPLERDYGLVFVPGAYKPKTKSGRSSRIGRSGSSSPMSELVTSPLRRSHWATPTHDDAQGGTNATLTRRSMTKIRTQVRFERRTPNASRGHYISPAFLEWLMGYPVGWTTLS